MALSSFDERIRGLQRLLVGHADDVEIDTAGRILVPPALRRYASLDKRVVLVGDTKNQPRAIAPTLTALYSVISEEIAIRNRQLGLDWATPLPTVPTLDSHDAAVDAEIVRHISSAR